jgi:glycosyltransferase involved in cell wall biosynthesis
VIHDMRANGRWGRWLLRLPDSLLVNSHAARLNAIDFGLDAGDVHVLPNVIDLAVFDEQAGRGSSSHGDAARPEGEIEGAAAGRGSARAELAVVGVGTFIRAKRFDRFLRALAKARSLGAPLRGVLVGDGPEHAALERLALELGLLPHAIDFVGRRTDVPALLRGCDIFALTSEHEGFPNVLLEAMAAGLPTVAMPAGDAAVVMEDEVTGFMVPPDDVDALAAKLVALAASEPLRTRLGAAGRRRVELCYSADGFAGRLGASYREIALRQRHHRSLAVLPV